MVTGAFYYCQRQYHTRKKPLSMLYYALDRGERRLVYEAGNTDGEI
ncbi:MAG: hypothetical protein PWP53_2802 [Lacrimispora sp.]|nr:hypothetical protein [Lacrimispora sp.]